VAEKLTRAQRLTLAFLETRPRPVTWMNRNLARRVGMLRLMEERGLVSRNSHNEWSISPAGRAALQHQEKNK
jgi:hypothetical protein